MFMARSGWKPSDRGTYAPARRLRLRDLPASRRERIRSAAALLRMLDDSVVSLFVSDEVLGEVRDVLSRPKVRQKNSRITDERVGALLTRLARISTFLKNVPRRFVFDPDPKAEKYVNLAIEADASYLVSHNRDLLDLMREDTPEAQPFGVSSPL